MDTPQSSSRLINEAMKTNPLMRILSKMPTYDDMAKALAFNPLANVKIQEYSLDDRSLLLAGYEQQFVPSAMALTICDAIRKMIYASYIVRKPSRSRYVDLARLGDMIGKKISHVQWFPNYAAGLCIEGITGLGKSKMIARIVSLLEGPVIQHEDCHEGGWAKQTQLSYLMVSAAADSSRGGFLLNILFTIDGVLGTSYATDYGSRQWTNEKLIVVVCVILSVHNCGLLVIDELQARSLGKSEADFTIFVLRLLNFGVPVVLCGHPDGVGKLKSHAQDLRRLSIGGWYSLFPPASENDFDFGVSAKGILTFSVMDQSFELTDTRLRAYYRMTAGIPGLQATLNFCAQEIALQDKRRVLEDSDFQEAFDTSPRIVEMKPLIHCLVERKAELLSAFEDIPVALYQQWWKSMAPLEQSSSPPLQEPKEVHVRGKQAQQLKSKETKQKRSEKKTEEVVAGLENEDVRRDKGASVLAAAFSALEQAHDDTAPASSDPNVADDAASARAK